MTNRQRRTTLRPEHAEELKIIAHLPGHQRQIPLPNGTCADIGGPYLIAEIEPLRRWQTGIAQLLEYWDQALRSPRPILILIEDGTNSRPKEQARIIRLCHSLGLTIWRWDPRLERFTEGGPRSIPIAPDYSPAFTWGGMPWTPPPESLRSCNTQREPYRTWFAVYRNRDHTRPTINHQQRTPPHGQDFRSA
jgi:hypothetical protein